MANFSIRLKWWMPPNGIFWSAGPAFMGSLISHCENLTQGGIYVKGMLNVDEAENAALHHWQSLKATSPTPPTTPPKHIQWRHHHSLHWKVSLKVPFKLFVINNQSDLKVIFCQSRKKMYFRFYPCSNFWIYIFRISLTFLRIYKRSPTIPLLCAGIYHFHEMESPKACTGYFTPSSKDSGVLEFIFPPLSFSHPNSNCRQEFKRF